MPLLYMAMREAKEDWKVFLIRLVMAPVEGLQGHTWGKVCTDFVLGLAVRGENQLQYTFS